MYKEIFEKFKIVGLNHFYGDFFDARGYVSYYLSTIKTKNIISKKIVIKKDFRNNEKY